MNASEDMQRQQRKQADMKPPELTPPTAARHPHTSEIHGDRRSDDYFWLREKENPEVIEYLEAENRHAEAAMAHTQALQDRLYQEMRSRIQEDDSSAPELHGPYRYYQRTEKDRQYPIFCRRADPAMAEEILLDQNALAEGRDFTTLGAMRISPDHRLLAYSVDHSGQETFTLYVKDLASGELLPDFIAGIGYGVEWANDNETLYYVTEDEAKRPHKVLRHHLGDALASDEVIFHEPDPLFYLSLSKSKSGDLLFIQLGSKTTNELHFLTADRPDGAPQVIQPRIHGLEYSVTHHAGQFYIVTNDNAVDFRLVVTPVATPGREHWQEIVPHRQGIKLDETDAFRDYLVLYLREDGLRQIQIFDLARGVASEADSHRVEFPEAVYTYREQRNPEFASDLLRFAYSSLTTPESVYDYNMATRTRELVKQEPVLGGYDPAVYLTERHHATAADGVTIPISLVYRKDLPLDGKRPLLLYGYGSYGICCEPAFDAKRLCLLERGVVFAIAHVRGGGEMGRTWYEHGKLLNKMNTFTDFVACAEYLVEHGFTTPASLVIHGRSAGGLLVGAATNLRPDLYRAVLAGVPFVDVINTMLDPSIPLTVTEYEEWGDPNDPVYYAYMKAYSPYDNLAGAEYPSILATAGLNDTRVHYWEPAKWVAKLRTHETGRKPVLLKTNMAAGHRGASGRFDRLRELAFEYAFVLDSVGIRE